MSVGMEAIKGIGAGIFASVLTAPVDKSLKGLISDKQKREEKKVRRASPHEFAGIAFAERSLNRRLSASEKKQAQLLFTLAYGVVWGLVYAGTRKAIPKASKFGGLGFALPFYVACDGIMAPNLKLSPGLQKIPWQFNIKEFANHAIWTALAETAFTAMENKNLLPQLLSKMSRQSNKVNSEYAFGSQPTVEDIQKCAQDGYKSIVNLRTQSEVSSDAELNPKQEADVAERHGLKYIHIPVDSDSPRVSDMHLFIRSMEQLPKPVFGHCASGKRAGVFYVGYMAHRHRWSFEKTLEYAKQSEIELTPKYESLLRDLCAEWNEGDTQRTNLQ